MHFYVLKYLFILNVKEQSIMLPTQMWYLLQSTFPRLFKISELSKPPIYTDEFCMIYKPPWNFALTALYNILISYVPPKNFSSCSMRPLTYREGLIPSAETELKLDWDGTDRICGVPDFVGWPWNDGVLFFWRCVIEEGGIRGDGLDSV